MKDRMKYRFWVLTAVWQYAHGVKLYFVLLFVVSAGIIGLNFVLPIFYKIFINNVILKSSFSMMYIVIAGYFAIYALNAGFSYMKNFAFYSFVNTILFRVRRKILSNFFDISFSEFEHVGVGDLKMCIDDDTNQIKSFVDVQTIDYVLALVTVLVSLVILVAIDWRITFFSIAAIPFTFWFGNLVSKQEEVINEKRRDNGQKMFTWLHASVQGWREVKALNLEKYEKRRYFRFLHTDMLYNAKWINYWTARWLVIPKIKDEFFMQFGLYFIGGLLILQDKLEIGDLLVFSMYYSLLSKAVNTISSTDADLRANTPYINRLLGSLRGKDDKDQRMNKIVPKYSGDIVMDHVSFAYPDTEEKIINDFSITIAKGERIAITGKSGCGKSTLLKLMTGMVVPTEGCVRFSEIDLREIDLEALHSKIGFIMQENILFNTSIRENLYYANENASEEMLWEACQKAYISDFILSLPDGLDTVIGEKGVKLSGGQRQRIVLARLFLRDIDVFIFDEATSALDQYSESIVHDAIRNISDDKTIIVVAHRESSISLCDRILRIDQGTGQEGS